MFGGSLEEQEQSLGSVTALCSSAVPRLTAPWHICSSEPQPSCLN